VNGGLRGWFWRNRASLELLAVYSVIYSGIAAFFTSGRECYAWIILFETSAVSFEILYQLHKVQRK
jgi:hypothetical protein